MSTDWIRRWDRFVELESTSTHLAQLWRSGELEASQTPIVVVTEQQTAGRGRGDHRWFSDSGSLTFTLGIVPESFGLSFLEMVPVGLLIWLLVPVIYAQTPSFPGALGFGAYATGGRIVGRRRNSVAHTQVGCPRAQA